MSEAVIAAERVEYLYDTSVDRLLVGRIVTNNTVSTAYDPASEQDIEVFAETVSNPSISIPQRKFSRERFAPWDMDDYRKYGTWILELTQSASEDVSHHIILNRSYMLGAGPSRDRIIDKARFGSVANFCKESGWDPKIRYGKFDHYEFQDFVDHIKNVIDDEGTLKITQGLLCKRIKDGANEPAPSLIREKTGSLTDVLKAAGVVSKVHMSNEELLNVWMPHVIQNQGEVPSAELLREASKQGRSPSQTTFINRFGSIRNYQKILIDRYARLSELEKGSDYQVGQSIKKGLESGELPIGLFRGAGSGKELVRRYQRFVVSETLLPHVDLSTKIRISIPAHNPKGFVAELKRIDPRLTKEDIDSVMSLAAA